MNPDYQEQSIAFTKIWNPIIKGIAIVATIYVFFGLDWKWYSALLLGLAIHWGIGLFGSFIAFHIIAERT